MKEDKKIYLILPGCDDTNRGDQALIWETVALAKEAGFKGQYYMVASAEKSRQSKAEMIDNIDYILPHPSTHFKKNNNITYGKLLKLKWATVSLIDGLRALALLCPVGRYVAGKFGNSDLRRSLSIYKQASAAFVKGGGFLHSYGGVISTYAVFYDLYHIILALSMGLDVYVMPNSYGPFRGPGSSWLIKKVLGKCKLVTARESVSQQALQKASGLEAELFPDLAFYLEPDANLTPEQEEKLMRIPFESRRCVALTMRPYRFPASEHPQEDYIQYKETLARFVVGLNQQGFYPVIMEHTHSESEHERDMSCIEDVVKLLGDSCEYSVYSDLSLTCRQLKCVYSRFAYIIGTRFHSVIFSLASRVPAIAITYGGNKGQGIMRDMGIEKYCIDIDALNIDKLNELFADLTQNTAAVHKKIDRYIASLPAEKERLIRLMRMDKE